MAIKTITYAEALREATAFCLKEDPSVYLMGLGVPDPKGIFGTTLGLQEEFGKDRVFDIPVSENGMTGIAIGSAIAGMRPILNHQRLDFALLTLEQLINQAAKWHYMFNGQMKVPLVVRMILGRGWGQGPQHSQALHALFAHVPGLKVVLPATPADARGLLISSVQDDNPVIFIDHRWLHQISGEVDVDIKPVPIGKARVAREGSDVTLVAISYMVLEALRAAELLEKQGVSAEVIDLRSVLPWDREMILSSLEKTGRLIVSDLATTSFSVGAEIIASMTEKDPRLFKVPPVRVMCPDHPTPTSHALAKYYYPRASKIAREALRLMGKSQDVIPSPYLEVLNGTFDTPDPSFKGPF